MSSNLVQEVQAKYAAVAASRLSSADAGVRAIAEAFGYRPEELATIPAEANMGLSCGNPTAFAGLRAGETVVDLGCGGGLDILLAGPKVGPNGKAIGIDMTPEMIARARQNAVKQSLSNVEFHLSTIDHLPLPDASVDCIISNCVINLAPDKRAVFREMIRVLRPGGRAAVSDIALKKALPKELASDVLAYIGCIAGAILIEDYRRGLRDVGFQTVEILDTHKDLRAYALLESQSGCCSPPMTSSTSLPQATSCCGTSGGSPTGSSLHLGLADLLKKYDVNEYAASVQVYALKA